MVEYEKKILLKKEEYHVLKNLIFSECPDITQKNYYYDQKDFAFNKCGTTCRIRRKNKKWEITVKKHNAFTDGGNIENTRLFTGKYDDSWFRSIGLVCFGTLKTTRNVLSPCKYVLFMLDRNEYLNTEDYELEIEYAQDHEAEAQDEIKKIARLLFLYCRTATEEFCSRVNAGKSKSERFFEVVRRSEKEREKDEICHR